ncbi:hypothetical protein G6F35_012061 [Rhizopus arrhizus]|nr:hypothetical protein G6F35_012061 [Rhizopus arrhizus]
MSPLVRTRAESPTPNASVARPVTWPAVTVRPEAERSSSAMPTYLPPAKAFTDLSVAPCSTALPKAMAAPSTVREISVAGSMVAGAPAMAVGWVSG